MDEIEHLKSIISRLLEIAERTRLHEAHVARTDETFWEYREANPEIRAAQVEFAEMSLKRYGELIEEAKAAINK